MRETNDINLNLLDAANYEASSITVTKSETLSFNTNSLCDNDPNLNLNDLHEFKQVLSEKTPSFFNKTIN